MKSNRIFKVLSGKICFPTIVYCLTLFDCFCVLPSPFPSLSPIEKEKPNPSVFQERGRGASAFGMGEGRLSQVGLECQNHFFL